MEGIYLLGIFILSIGGSIILSVIAYWVKQKIQMRKQKSILSKLPSMSQDEKNTFLKNGGDINISKKEVEEYGRTNDLRRRKLADLRELEASSRNLQKGINSNRNNGQVDGRGDLPLDAPKHFGEEHESSRGNSKKVRLSRAEEF